MTNKNGPIPRPGNQSIESTGRGRAQLNGALRHTIARGVLWLTFQAIGVKGITAIGQIGLAWLLIPAEFGLVALAYSVTALTAIVMNAGMREILVQREGEFNILVTPATWVSLLIGIAAALLTLGVAPFAARAYGSPELVGLLLVLALALPARALRSIPTAMLQNSMDFRTISLVGLGEGAGIIVLSLGLAALGFGPYSLMIPIPVAAAVSLGVLWYKARPPVLLTPQLHLWGVLVAPGALLLGASLFEAVAAQGATVILGLLQEPEAVGQFFFASNLSSQIVVMLALNVSHVLLPSFSKLQSDPDQQLAAVTKATRIITGVGVPLAFLSSAVADPAVRAVFDERWLPAIPLLQILGVGVAVDISSHVSISALKGQGRFSTYMRVAASRAALLILLVGVGAVYRGTIGAALGATVFAVVQGIGSYYLAVRVYGRGWADVRSMFVGPLTAGLIALVAAVGVGRQMPDETTMDHWMHMIVSAAICVGVYGLVLRRVATQTYAEVRDAMTHLHTMWKAKSAARISLAA